MKKPDLIKKANRFLEDDNIVILDTKTTGSLDTDEIIELGIIDNKGNELFYSLFKPITQLTAEASAVNGITQADLENAPTWEEKFFQIKAVLEDKAILMYNSQFNMSMIQQTSMIHDCNWLDIDCTSTNCIMLMYADYVKSQRWISLQNACHYEGVEINQDHRAIGDCLMTLELIKAMAK